MGLSRKDMDFTEAELDIFYSELTAAVKSFVKMPADMDVLLRDEFHPLMLKKGTHFIKQGEVSSAIAFINRGFFRYYHISNGEEITSDFSFEKTFITSFISLITGEPSRIAVQALDDSMLLVLKRSRLYELYETNHTMERMGRLLAEKAFTDNTNHLLSFLNDKAAIRYQNLLEQAPHMVQKIPLVYIASYLGISPETLSRIRKKIR